MKEGNISSSGIIKLMVKSLIKMLRKQTSSLIKLVRYSKCGRERERVKSYAYY